MTSFINNQSSLFEKEVRGELSVHDSFLVSLVLDHRQWLNLLADEWWPTRSNEDFLRLGINSPVASEIVADRISVIAWINPALLMETIVEVKRCDEWTRLLLSDIHRDDDEFIWSGPVPLFAVENFSVTSEEHRSRLMATARSFGNLAQDFAPIYVKATEIRLVDNLGPIAIQRFAPPTHWDALRGAAAMAVWAAPTVEPWMQLLTDALNNTPNRDETSTLGAIWWSSPPWKNRASPSDNNLDLILWNAILDVLPLFRPRDGWSPLKVFDEIVQRLTNDDAILDYTKELVDATLVILSDQRSVDFSRGETDPLGLTLQLLLLRPTPEKFISWKNEYPGLSPAVWWTGATLSGYICGFRDLEVRFRGGAMNRRVLAIRMWEASRTKGDELAWTDAFSLSKLTWRSTGELAILECQGIVLAEKQENNRAKWYRADLRNMATRKAALTIAKEMNPNSLRQIMSVTNADIFFSGPGIVQAENDEKKLAVSGEVVFKIPVSSRIDFDLNDELFRQWIAKGSIAIQLSMPPYKIEQRESRSVSTNKERAPLRIVDSEIRGLVEIPNFISLKEEEELVAFVDNAQWSTSLSRRVQHYGWHYDYKTGKVSTSKRAAPMPAWAEILAERLYQMQLFPELPDQMIVNEYVGKQGIAPHIDAPASFEGPIATISLIESWEMIFRRKYSDDRVVRVLERGSATVLDGEARYSWTHEIPKRLKESWGTRGRRVSLTFRKVKLSSDFASK